MKKILLMIVSVIFIVNMSNAQQNSSEREPLAHDRRE